MIKFLAFIVGSCLCISAFATEPVAKLDTTPPPPEGPLTAADIPPITNIGKPPATPAAPTQAPAPAAKPTTPPANSQSPVSFNEEDMNNIPPEDEGQNIQYQ